MDVFIKVRKLILPLGLLFGLLVLFGCDIFKNEEKDWENGVLITVSNQSNCLIDLFIDGTMKEGLAPGEEFEEDEFGRGIHLLEAYPWNDEQFNCDHVFTPELSPGDTYDWIILADGGCRACDPTPTPDPATPTPSPTPGS